MKHAIVVCSLDCGETDKTQKTVGTHHLIVEGCRSISTPDLSLAKLYYAQTQKAKPRHLSLGTKERLSH